MSRHHRQPPKLQLHLAELRAVQSAKRRRIYAELELDEARALSKLAHRLFGPRGVVEFDSHPLTRARTGPIQISVYLPGYSRGMRGPDGGPAPTLVMFQGATIAELEAQAALWQARQS